MENKDNFQKLKELVEKIEFHEVKTSDMFNPGVETQVYAKADMFFALAEWLSGKRWSLEYDGGKHFKSECDHAMRSRKERPHFSCRLDEVTVEVYPKQKMFTYFEGGLHYICQHSFDMFPYDVKSAIHSVFSPERDINLGYFYGRILRHKTPEPLMVTCNDISVGFMLDTVGIHKYHDDFGFFISQRNKVRQEKIEKEKVNQNAKA